LSVSERIQLEQEIEVGFEYCVNPRSCSYWAWLARLTGMVNIQNDISRLINIQKMTFLCRCNVLRWIWCLWCYSECISTPVVDSIPTVARQACPVWIYTQSNVTSIQNDISKVNYSISSSSLDWFQ
jgi:hypothetical protein